MCGIFETNIALPGKIGCNFFFNGYISLESCYFKH